MTGFARSCGWLSMYVGLPWVFERGQALAASAFDRLARIPGVTMLTPRDRMATLVTFRIAGWPADDAVRELGARVFAITRTVPPLDAIRISVGFFNTADELERFAEAVELLAAHTPATLPPQAAADDHRAGLVMARDPAANPASPPSPASPPRRRSPVEIRWRQFRNAPRPVVRAVLSSLIVASVLAAAYLAYDVAISRGAVLPGGDLRVLFVAVLIAAVLVTGSVVTYLVVPLPKGSGDRGRRSAWSAALGLFAAVPICYLVLVVAVQILKPLFT